MTYHRVGTVNVVELAPGTTIRVTGPDGTVLSESVTDQDGTFTVTLSAAQAVGTALDVVAIDAAGVPSAPATIVVTADAIPVPPVDPAPVDPAPVDLSPAPAPVPSASATPVVPGSGDDTRQTADGSLAFTGSDLATLSLLSGIPILAGTLVLTGLWLRRRRAAAETAD